MPSLIVRDAIITLPAGSLETADRAKVKRIRYMGLYPLYFT
jgi:hypothetical protein